MPDAAQRQVDELVRLARVFYRRGWMWGTSGNLSVKLSDRPRRIAVTASGWSKGKLTYDGIAIEPAEARSELPWLPGSPAPKPSAETCIHRAIYDAAPDAGAVLHVHTVAGTLLSMHEAAEGQSGAIEVEGLEMLKGWGLRADQRARLPIVPNWPELDRIAGAVANQIAHGSNVPVILVYGHGTTAWGRDLEQAKNHLEIAEFIFQVLWQRHLARS